MSGGRLGSGYVLGRPVGGGAAGEVWESTDAAGERVAIKLLHPHLVRDPDMVARFVRERQALRAVRSPHVVGIRDLVVDDHRVAIVMEFVDGLDLRRFLAESGGRLQPRLATEICAQILDALDAVHRSGILHRDVKPENVLVDRSPHGQPIAKLSDFGIARLVDAQSITRATGVLGTPRYMAPELGREGSATPASDIYAVGIVLYELLTGRPPFTGDSPLAVLRAHADDPVPASPHVPEALRAVVASLLAKDPRDRPRDALAAFEAVRDAGARADRLPTLADAVPPAAERTTVHGECDEAPMPEPVPPRTRHRSLRVFTLGTSALTLIVAAVFLLVAHGGNAATNHVALAWVDRYPDYSVSREWSITGSRHDTFNAVETVLNTSSSALPPGTRYLVVLPKSLARDVDRVRFNGRSPSAVVQHDPVVAFDLDGLLPGHRAAIAYSVRVAAGATTARLEHWNEEQQAERKRLRLEQPRTERAEPTSTTTAVVQAALGVDRGQAQRGPSGSTPSSTTASSTTTTTTTTTTAPPHPPPPVVLASVRPTPGHTTGTQGTCDPNDPGISTAVFGPLPPSYVYCYGFNYAAPGDVAYEDYEGTMTDGSPAPPSEIARIQWDTDPYGFYTIYQEGARAYVTNVKADPNGCAHATFHGTIYTASGWQTLTLYAECD